MLPVGELDLEVDTDEVATASAQTERAAVILPMVVCWIKRMLPLGTIGRMLPPDEHEEGTNRNHDKERIEGVMW